MSPAAFEDLRPHVYETTNPEVRRRRGLIIDSLLEHDPEKRAEIEAAGELQGKLHATRAMLRDALDARGIAVSSADEARIDACTDLGTLRRWHKQAVVATSAADALR